MPPARSVRQGRYKYVYYHDDRDTLFDIEVDPREQHNLLDWSGASAGHKRVLFAWTTPENRRTSPVGRG